MGGGRVVGGYNYGGWGQGYIVFWMKLVVCVRTHACMHKPRLHNYINI